MPTQPRSSRGGSGGRPADIVTLLDGHTDQAMDIALSSNSSTAALELREIQRYADGSGFVTLLVVRSGGFAAALPFYFELPRLMEFVEALQGMDRTLSGSATLKPTWEPGFVTFELDQHGHVRVFGELRETTEHEQWLQFSFNTDQTCLRQFAADLEACQSLAAI